MSNFLPHLKRAVEIVGSQGKLARAVGVSQPAINNRLQGKTDVMSGEMAIAIERATDGQVSRSDLRPDLWPRGDAA